MTVTRDQAENIAAIAAAVRPANAEMWDQAGIVAALAKCRERDLANVAMAALRAAVDPKAVTPGVIPTAGPHWNERLTDTSVLLDRGPWCGSCGQTQTAPIHTKDHQFTERKPAVDAETRAKYVAQYRDRAAENPGPAVLEQADDNGPCGPDCIRGNGHTGQHLPPPATPAVAVESDDERGAA